MNEKAIDALIQDRIEKSKIINEMHMLMRTKDFNDKHHLNEEENEKNKQKYEKFLLKYRNASLKEFKKRYLDTFYPGMEEIIQKNMEIRKKFAFIHEMNIPSDAPYEISISNNVITVTSTDVTDIDIGAATKYFTIPYYDENGNLQEEDNMKFADKKEFQKFIDSVVEKERKRYEDKNKKDSK